MYNYFVIPVIALFCYIFLLVSLMAAKKNRIINSFIGLLLVLVVWASGSLFMRLEYWPSMEFWFHTSLMGMLLLPAVFFLFLRRFLDVPRTYHMHFWTFAILVLIGINYKTEIFVGAPQVIVSEKGNQAFVYDIPSSVWVLFAVMAVVLFQCARLVYENSRKNVFVPSSLRSVWVGIGFLALGHVCLLFPVFKGFPIDVFSGIPMAVCLYYALYRKRLLHLDMLVSKANCYVAAFVLAILVFYRIVPDTVVFLREESSMGVTEIAMAVSLAVMGSTILIYTVLKYFLDALFEDSEGLRAKNIRRFSEKAMHLMSVREILGELLETIQSTINSENTYIFLKDENGKCKVELTSARDGEEFLLVLKEEQIDGLLRDMEGCLLMRDYKGTSHYRNLLPEAKENLLRFKVECVAAIKEEEEYLGYIFLSAKKRGRRYTEEDVNFLTSANSVASIAIKNSRLYDQAYREARSDYLTCLSNRKFFYEMLRKCCRENAYECGAVLLVDVDDFKLYNQLYGSDEGDDALRRIGEIIKREVGDKCVAARYSGKIFALLLPAYTEQMAKELAESLSLQIKEMNKNAGDYAMKALTVSCGIALGICPIEDYRELVNRAETAVYYAKQAGKNRVRVYREGHDKKETAGNSELNYQPGVYSDYAPTIYALTAAIDAKDHYTFSHSENVAYYARELAKAYGMNDEGISIVYEAGLLHDIGKIGIPENILNKPGELSEEELQMMKTHVELSIGIIRHLPSLDYVIPAVIGHHERYDGKGYPRMIQGEEIPLMARILCIADSFDAMISQRSYKPRMEVDKALAILKEEAGRQFDPKLVPVFTGLVEGKSVEVR